MTEICIPGSCCELDGTCTDDVLHEVCLFAGGTFDSATVCDGSCEARGCCCVAQADVAEQTETACTDAGGNYLGDETVCVGGCGVGACCQGEAVCTEEAEVDCMVDGEDNYFGDGTTCDGLDVDCTVGACCSPKLEFCYMATQATCQDEGGLHQLGGTECVTETCEITILASMPTAGAIDARQPSNPDGTDPAGLETVEILFTGNPALLVPEDLVVEVLAEGATAPKVLSVIVDQATVSVQLDQAIPTGAWTSIRHVSSGTTTWFGSLPGDVNGDRTADTADITAVVDCVRNPGSCFDWQCDIDRSGMCAPADILRVIDIINGVGAFAGVSDGGLPEFPGVP